MNYMQASLNNLAKQSSSSLDIILLGDLNFPSIEGQMVKDKFALALVMVLN